MEWYADLAANNADVIKFVPSIGKSVEGRDQPAVHITDGWQEKDKVYFQCQIHASKTKSQSPAVSIYYPDHAPIIVQGSGYLVLCACTLPIIL